MSIKAFVSVVTLVIIVQTAMSAAAQPSSFHQQKAEQKIHKIKYVLDELKCGEENALKFNTEQWSATWYAEYADELKTEIQRMYPPALFAMKVYSYSDHGVGFTEVSITPITVDSKIDTKPNPVRYDTSLSTDSVCSPPTGPPGGPQIKAVLSDEGQPPPKVTVDSKQPTRPVVKALQIPPVASLTHSARSKQFEREWDMVITAITTEIESGREVSDTKEIVILPVLQCTGAINSLLNVYGYSVGDVAKSREECYKYTSSHVGTIKFLDVVKKHNENLQWRPHEYDD